jgi:hypothetical protein
MKNDDGTKIGGNIYIIIYPYLQNKMKLLSVPPFLVGWITMYKSCLASKQLVSIDFKYGVVSYAE